MKIITCPNCDMKYRLDPAKFTQPEVRIRCKKCGNAFAVRMDEAPDEGAPAAAAKPTPAPASPPAAAPKPAVPPTPTPAAAAPAPAAAAATSGKAPQGARALVAHDHADVRDGIRDLLIEAGFAVTAVDNGIDALMHIEQQKPAVAILDVALPKMFGFEVCEIVRRDNALDGVKLLLIAAIYDRTRYKRAPNNLYGADDYIEKHHIPDALVDKALRLIGAAPSGPREETTHRVVPPEQEAREEEQRQAIRRAETAPKIDEALLERARRLARTIVSDIALYNQEAIVEGVRKNNLRELLKNEFHEGRQLFDSRVAEEVRGTESFLDDAIDQLIASKRKELGL